MQVGSDCAPAAPSDRVRSVSRALRILEAVGGDGGPVSAKRVARLCGLHLSTTYHLLRTLCYEGYLTRDEQGGYRLGLEIADRFRDLVTTLDTPRSARAALRTLAVTTGHSAYLARFVEGRVTVVSVAEAPGSPPLDDLVVGFDEAAHATALGKALLSTLPPAIRRAYLHDQGMRRFTTATLTAPDSLDDDLAHQPPGVFEESGQFRDGVACVAALIDDPARTEPWALALSAAPGRLRARRPDLTQRLRSTATHLAGARAAAVPA